MMMETERTGYWSTAQAAEQGIYKDLLYGWRQRGLLVAYKFPRDRRNYWRIEDIQRICDEPTIRSSRLAKLPF